MDKTNIRNYWNYGYHSKKSSVHYCDCISEKPYKFYYGHKNGHGDILTVQLSLCPVCYTSALFKFYVNFKKGPQLRCDGGRVRKYVIDILDNQEEYENWKSSPIFKELVEKLPLVYNCTFYRNESYIVSFDKHFIEAQNIIIS
jgi:hypothetical protein